MRFVLVLLLFLPNVGLSSEPRKDLYRKISMETGVSLKKAMLAVDERNYDAQLSLQIYARRMGIDGIRKVLLDEATAIAEHCKSRKAKILCRKEQADNAEKLSFVNDLNSGFDSLNSFKKTYFTVLVYCYAIKFLILKHELETWNKRCGAEEKLNDRICRDDGFEIQVLNEISYDIAELALEKLNSTLEVVPLRRKIREALVRYEP